MINRYLRSSPALQGTLEGLLLIFPMFFFLALGAWHIKLIPMETVAAYRAGTGEFTVTQATAFITANVYFAAALLFAFSLRKGDKP